MDNNTILSSATFTEIGILAKWKQNTHWSIMFSENYKKSLIVARKIRNILRPTHKASLVGTWLGMSRDVDTAGQIT